MRSMLLEWLMDVGVSGFYFDYYYLIFRCAMTRICTGRHSISAWITSIAIYAWWRKEYSPNGFNWSGPRL
jgi:hypothetical protein